jgi:hypothetical protein
MDQTAPQIEAHIKRTRERLGSDLRELGTRVDAATDWKEHVRQRPYLWIGGALVGGVVLSQVARPRAAARLTSMARPNLGQQPRSRRVDPVGQFSDLWETVAHAMLGVVATRVKSYIGDVMPGFSEELARVESRPAGSAARQPGQGFGASEPAGASLHER